MTEPRPLEGVVVGVPADGVASVLMAARLMSALGATFEASRCGPRVLLISHPQTSTSGVASVAPWHELEIPRLPPNTLDYALALCLLLSVGLTLLRSGHYRVDPAPVALQLVLPLALGMAPSMSRSRGRGMLETDAGVVWCDLDEDELEVLDELVAGSVRVTSSAMELAKAAQDIGLTVIDFRQRDAWKQGLPVCYLMPHPVTGDRAERPAKLGSDEAPLHGVRVCDLTAMWSGPLATWMLGSLGADVIKIEPDCRLDGLRSRGSEDLGVSCAATAAPAFHALNRNKRRAPLDLREADQRETFLRLAADSQLLVSNFSPRVAGNLGIAPVTLMRSRHDPLVSLQMPAFPSGVRERHWRAYGGGVHAVSGLGMTVDAEPWTAATPYCDCLTGFAAAATAVLLHWAAQLSHRSWSVEVPMLNVARRLCDFTSVLGQAPRDDERRLERNVIPISGADGGQRVRVGGASFVLPRNPISGPGLPVLEAPAPGLGDAVPAP